MSEIKVVDFMDLNKLQRVYEEVMIGQDCPSMMIGPLRTIRALAAHQGDNCRADVKTFLELSVDMDPDTSIIMTLDSIGVAE